MTTAIESLVSDLRRIESETKSSSRHTFSHPFHVRNAARQAAEELERLHGLVEWDGKGTFFDSKCPCPKCAEARQAQRNREREAAAA